jgi:hypothetical protein
LGSIDSSVAPAGFGDQASARDRNAKTHAPAVRKGRREPLQLNSGDKYSNGVLSNNIPASFEAIPDETSSPPNDRRRGGQVCKLNFQHKI